MKGTWLTHVHCCSPALAGPFLQSSFLVVCSAATGNVSVHRLFCCMRLFHSRYTPLHLPFQGL